MKQALRQLKVEHHAKVLAAHGDRDALREAIRDMMKKRKALR
jgi:phosphoribosylcarboxyaminoimidazole (NCAIR) mutase